jgi:glycosyltransferase involved in cell wall biosynthesis
MKIVHVSPHTPYRFGWTYQENVLSRLQAEAGHDVTVIATSFRDSDESAYVEVEGKVYRDGEVEIRKARKVGAAGFAWLPRLTKQLESLRPDLVFLHGGQTMVFFQVSEYVKKHGECVLFVDFHSDSYNTGRNALSRVILHRFVWRLVLAMNVKYAARLYCLSPDIVEFMRKMYGIPEERLTLTFLGADLARIPYAARDRIAKEVRKELGIPEGDLVVVSGGKLNPGKRLSELARAIGTISGRRLTLLVFGTFQGEYENVVRAEDVRGALKFVGWCDEDRINRLLLASDIAAFPGTQSALWQQAICAGLPCILGDWPGTHYLNEGNVVFVTPGDVKSLAKAIDRLANDDLTRCKMADISMRLAREKFSYSVISGKILDDYEEAAAP